MDKIALRTKIEVIAGVVIILICLFVYMKLQSQKNAAFENGHKAGYSAGLAKGLDSCTFKISESIKTIISNEQEKQKIFNEPINDSKRRFDSLYPANNKR